MRKYAGKNVRLNRVSTSQPPGHASDTLNTEPPGLGESYLTLRVSKAIQRIDYCLLPKQIDKNNELLLKKKKNE